MYVCIYIYIYTYIHIYIYRLIELRLVAVMWKGFCRL